MEDLVKVGRECGENLFLDGQILFLRIFIESHLDMLPTRFSFVCISLFNERGFASSFQTFKMNRDM
jgi:hypothetical protein